MRIPVLCLLAVALAAPAGAEVWQWTDQSGATSFTDDPGTIPAKYRGKAVKLGAEEPVEAPEAPGAVAGENARPQGPDRPAASSPERKKQEASASAPAGKEAPAAGKGGERPANTGQQPSGAVSYGGKAAEAWQAEFAAANAEINGLKQEVGEKRNRLATDSALPREEYFKLQKDVADAEKRYAESYARKQELVKQADKAGVPNDLRW